MSEVTSASKATSDKQNASTESTPKKSWFKGLKSEFKKIIWPTKASVARQTTAVVLITVVLGAVIVVIDRLVQMGFGRLF